MKTTCLLFAVVAALWGPLAAVRAGDFQRELDSRANPRMFQTHFTPYGFAVGDAMVLEEQGLRFRFASGSHVGLYSYFALAGDFEVSATYESLAGFSPSGGGRVSCGIAIETESDWGNVALTRCCDNADGSGYVALQGKSSGAGRTREPLFFPSSARSGVLLLRRERQEVICLAADAQGAEAQELCRLPFTDGTIRKVRIFAESRGSSSALDARMNMSIKAEEVTGGTPKRELGTGLGWWWLAPLLFAGILGYWLYRRRRAGLDEVGAND